MEKPEVSARVKSAIEELFDKDDLLLELDVNERSISHKLAIYLERQFCEWDVDCEHNRFGWDDELSKVLDFREIERCFRDRNLHFGAVSVFPDIIVHNRGCKKNNLLAIEIKKFGDDRGKECDIIKLFEFKRQLNYEHCLFIQFETRAMGRRYLVFDEEGQPVSLEN
jgi:hypothetical protein